MLMVPRRLVDAWFPLGFRGLGSIRPSERADQCTETGAKPSLTTVAWIRGCSEPPKYWRYGIYTDFRFALPISFFPLSMDKLTLELQQNSSNLHRQTVVYYGILVYLDDGILQVRTIDSTGATQ